jgi:hypothetical protein
MSDAGGQEDREGREGAERGGRGRPAWIAGGVLILIGLVFVLRNVTGLALDNWWALFILIPAGGSLWSAWSLSRRKGHFTTASTGPLVGGLLLLTLTVVFFFKLEWAGVWPVFLIVAGAGVLLGAFTRQRPPKG